VLLLWIKLARLSRAYALGCIAKFNSKKSLKRKCSTLLKHFYKAASVVGRSTLFHCVVANGGRSMTIEFLWGLEAAMLPSMLTVAWLVWRAA
jgi:hypothetical protein